MNGWIRRRIAVLRECFSTTSRLVRQQILLQRELFAKESPFNKLIWIVGFLLLLSFPTRLFVPKEQLDKILALIFFGSLIVYFLWHERYPALKRWIAETEHGQKNGKYSHSDQELKQNISRLRRSNTVGFVPPTNKQYCGAVCKEVPPPSIGRRVFRIFGRIFSYRILPKWQSLHLTERLYLVAFVVMFLGFVSSGMSGNISYFKGTVLLAYAACSLGFVIWIWPWLQKIWRSSVGKLAITLLNGSVLLIDVIYARLLVADALGLPPQDFDMTVAVCAWIFYIPVWLMVVALLAAVMAIIFQLYAFLLMLIDTLVQPIDLILSLILFFILLCFIYIRLLYLLITRFSAKDIAEHFNQPFPVGANLSHFFEQQPRGSLINRSKLIKAGFRNFSHVIGIIGIIAAVAYAWQSYPAVTESLKPAVRALAYIVDFQQVPLYPGVEVNKRLRLHENGVVSYAEERGGDIVISVEKVQ
jgi:hypothetical protein